MLTGSAASDASVPLLAAQPRQRLLVGSLCGSSFAARALGARRRHRNGHARARGTGCRHFAAMSWPLSTRRPGLLVAAGLLLVLAQALKAFGWGRLFTRSERPTTLALAAGNGGAALVGVLLPGRFDDAMRVAVVRRYPGCRAGVRVLCLSLVMLGLIDSVALAPLALAGAALPNVGAGVRVGLAVVAVGGVAAAIVISSSPPGCEPMDTALSARPLGEPAHHVATSRVGGLGARVRLLARARGRVLSPPRRVRRRVFVDAGTSVPLHRGSRGSASGRACRHGHAGRRGWRRPCRSWRGCLAGTPRRRLDRRARDHHRHRRPGAAIIWRSALSLLASRAPLSVFGAVTKADRHHEDAGAARVGGYTRTQLSAMRTAIVSTFPPRPCGIGTFAADLRGTLTATGTVKVADLVAVVHEPSSPQRRGLLATITQAVRGDYVRTARMLGRLDVDVVLLQHEYGIFGGRDGSTCCPSHRNWLSRSW